MTITAIMMKVSSLAIILVALILSLFLTGYKFSSFRKMLLLELSMILVSCRSNISLLPWF